jgi:hypothetical protein
MRVRRDSRSGYMHFEKKFQLPRDGDTMDSPSIFLIGADPDER